MFEQHDVINQELVYIVLQAVAVTW